jgi:hypothetical protein
MDHLPLPSGATYPRFEIPCEKPTYYGSPFLDFPTRVGWDLTRLLRGDFSERSLKETTAMLQNWIFFGLLSEFSGGDLRPDDFIRWSDDQKLITTEKLVPRLTEWKSTLLTRELSARESWLKNIEACLDMASTVVRSLGKFPSIISGELLLSFMALGSSLSYVRKWMILPRHPDSFGVEDGAYVLSWGTSLTLVSRLFNSGWCPTDIARVHSMFDILGMYEASFLRQPQGAVLHTSCTREVCVEDSIDELEYHKIYDELNSGTFEGPDSKKVKAILEAGSFPLVRLSSSTESPIVQGVVAYHPGLPYTAISYVWSHGLGNPSANALTTSQLKELQAYLSALNLKNGSNVASVTGGYDKNDVYIWIDTLCVPLDKEVRKIALRMINAAYTQASSVLVLDTSLKCISCKASYAELALRIYSSRWMQRLWTLAEGVLAQRLCFQFLDGTVTLDELAPALQVSSHQIFMSHLHTLAFRPLMVFRRIRIIPMAERFEILWNAITYRSTSKTADEPIILASISGFNEVDMSRIINAPDEKKMETFFSFWDNLPARILFAAGRHLNSIGYGWAVQSLLKRGDLAAYDYSKSGRYSNIVAQRVPRGLVIRQTGYLLKENAALLPQQFQVMDGDDTQALTIEQEPHLYLSSSDAGSSGSHPLSPKPHVSAIILSSPQPFEISSGQYAALVTVSGEENGTIYCEWRSRIWISRSDKEHVLPIRDPSGTHAAFSSASLDGFNKRKDLQSPLNMDGGNQIFRVKKVEEQQEWCIA